MTKEELRPYAKLYDDIIEGCVSTERHRHESYWLDMPDKRAMSFCFTREDATLDNGCMWFVRGSHVHEKGLRKQALGLGLRHKG